MKYHAPVRELLAQRVRGLDQPFTSDPVLALLDPSLNLSHMRGTVIRSQLTRLRSAWKQ